MGMIVSVKVVSGRVGISRKSPSNGAPVVLSITQNCSAGTGLVGVNACGRGGSGLRQLAVAGETAADEAGRMKLTFEHFI